MTKNSKILLIILGIVIVGGLIVLVSVFQDPAPMEEVVEIKESEEIADWSAYKNKELGFELRIPPLFEEIGCTIREISNRQYYYFDQKECFYLSLDTMSIDPLWGEDRSGEFIGLFVCPLSHCEGRENLCEAIKKDKLEFEGEPLFAKYITEGSQYFIFSQGGPGHGDFYDGMGWLREEIANLRSLMISSIKFIDDLPEEDQKEWMEEESNAKCDYDDDFAPEGVG